MKIIVLSENTSVNNEFLSEHGLSLYIETDGLKILFDMGQSDLFLRNAEKLNVDISSVDLAVISHGHYDHGGGLRYFLQANSKAPVYINKNAFGSYYNGTEKYIGLDLSLSENPRLIFTDDEYTIQNNIKLFTANGREKLYNSSGSGLNKMVNDRFFDDDFAHEQYLQIEEKGKKILVSGCSHKGALNVVKWFSPDVFIGGFHYSKMELNDQLKEYALTLNGCSAEYFTCHCTGVPQYEFMKKYIKSLSYISTGAILEI